MPINLGKAIAYLDLDSKGFNAKLNEAKIEDEELFNSLKEKYAEILVKRKEARAKINELEAQ